MGDSRGILETFSRNAKRMSNSKQTEGTANPDVTYYYVRTKVPHPSELCQRSAGFAGALRILYLGGPMVSETGEEFDAHEVFEKEEQLLMMMKYIPEDDRKARTSAAFKREMRDSVELMMEGCRTGKYVLENVEGTMEVHASIADDMDEMLKSLVKRGYLEEIPLCTQ